MPVLHLMPPPRLQSVPPPPQASAPHPLLCPIKQEDVAPQLLLSPLPPAETSGHVFPLGDDGEWPPPPVADEMYQIPPSAPNLVAELTACLRDLNASQPQLPQLPEPEVRDRHLNT